LDVLARPAEEEEAQEGHVTGGMGLGAAELLGSQVDLFEDREGDWFDALGLRVEVAVAFQQARKSDVNAARVG
jgi:hypothetical protein